MGDPRVLYGRADRPFSSLNFLIALFVVLFLIGIIFFLAAIWQKAK